MNNGEAVETAYLTVAQETNEDNDNAEFSNYSALSLVVICNPS